MKYTKIIKAFTLVELIVVITILAILWTIAFVQLQSYAQMARNSIRVDDMSKIATLLNNGKVTGKNLFGYSLWGEEIPNIQIWWTGAIDGTNYISWDINRSALNVKITQFIDPLIGRAYKLWYSSKIKWIWEIATTMESGNSQIARVEWTYSPRTQEAISGVGTLWEKTFRLWNISDIGKFYVGDVVIGTEVPTNTSIVNISNDGLLLTLEKKLTGDASIIKLWTDETKWLILWYGTVDTPVVDWGTVLPYNLH